jgi:hypothetical protein
VFGRTTRVNCYLDIEFGEATLVADWVYICDFDHVIRRRDGADQGPGHREVPGPDRARRVDRREGVDPARRARRRGSVIASHCLVNKDVPAYSVAVGVPARVVRNRLDDYRAAEAKRAALADIARKGAEVAGRQVNRRHAANAVAMPTPRALLAAALVAAPLALAATPAHAVPTCPQPGSTTLLSAETVVGGHVDLLASGDNVCLYSNAAGIVVVAGPGTHVEVWRTGNALTDDVLCLREYVVYHLDESQSDLWYDCWQYAHRIL